jgi:hypothetical protein
MALSENIRQIKSIWNNNLIHYVLRFAVFIIVLILNVDDMLI